MALTTAQLATLKTDIIAKAVPGGIFEFYLPGNNFNYIANIYNTVLATPDFFVWRTDVPVTEIMGNGFDWTRVDNMTVGEARIWEFMTQLGSINPNQANVRSGINEAFKGTAQDDTMRLAIYTNHLQKKATHIEKLFSSGAGTTSTNSGAGPATVTVTSVTEDECRQAIQG